MSYGVPHETSPPSCLISVLPCLPKSMKVILIGNFSMILSHWVSWVGGGDCRKDFYPRVPLKREASFATFPTFPTVVVTEMRNSFISVILFFKVTANPGRASCLFDSKVVCGKSASSSTVQIARLSKFLRSVVGENPCDRCKWCLRLQSKNLARNSWNSVLSILHGSCFFWLTLSQTCQ